MICTDWNVNIFACMIFCCFPDDQPIDFWRLQLFFFAFEKNFYGEITKDRVGMGGKWRIAFVSCIKTLWKSSDGIWNSQILFFASTTYLVEYAPRLFPCSSHHPQEFLSLEWRNLFYPAKKAEPRIFWVPRVLFTPGRGVQNSNRLIFSI